jgi:hypothetical protein
MEEVEERLHKLGLLVPDMVRGWDVCGCGYEFGGSRGKVSMLWM